MARKRPQRRNRQPPPPVRRRVPGFLDAFTAEDVDLWHKRSLDARIYANGVFFDLEKQRVAHHDEIVAALRDAGGIEVPIKDWVRITDYQWSLTPLSALGSVKGIGGRFNVGEALSLRAKTFPALYIGHDADTAMYEYFGGPPSTSALSAHELMLRRPTSFATFSVNGNLENVLDLRDHQKLDAFVEIVKKFKLTKETREIARKAGIAPRELIRTSKQLQTKLFEDSKTWRVEPLMTDIPAPSQLFGRYIAAAGYEALLFPSQQGGTLCLAVYPQNFEGSESYLEVKGPHPMGATCTRLDRNSLCLDGIDGY